MDNGTVKTNQNKGHIPVPDVETYNQADVKNYKSSFALNLSILNRTTWSNAKAFKSNMRENDTCDKCRQTETIVHIFLDCEMIDAESIWEQFRCILKHCKSKPRVIMLS